MPQKHEKDSLLTVIQQAHEFLGTKELILSGGEVFLYPYWHQVVDYGRSLGMSVSIITNGIAVTDQVALFLLDRQVEICVSLAGTSEEEDAPLRGHSAWIRSLRGLTILSQTGLRVGLAYIIHRHNLGSAQRAVAIAADHQVAWLRFSLIRYLGRAQLHWEKIGLSLAERVSFVQEYAQLEHPETIDIILEPDPELDKLGAFFNSLSRESDNYKEDNLNEICLRFDTSVNLGNQIWDSWDSFLQEQTKECLL